MVYKRATCGRIQGRERELCLLGHGFRVSSSGLGFRV